MHGDKKIRRLSDLFFLAFYITGLSYNLMKLLRPIELSDESPCPYIDGINCRFRYFFASDLSAEELDVALSSGWRKFGLYYFQPSCECSSCVPLRVRAKDFTPSKDQRRIIAKNSDIVTKIAPLEFRDEIYDMYCEHSDVRFQKSSESKDIFIQSFFTPSCPSFLSEFYLDDTLVAVGFVDQSTHALSSVYFIYRAAMQSRGMGIFGMCTEIRMAAELGLDFYYSGYYIKQNARMNYKGRFRPHELFDGETGLWRQDTEYE